MQKICQLSLLIGALVYLSACGGGTQVSVSLQNINSTRMTHSANRLETSTEVTINSLKIPIRDISLGTGDALSGSADSANSIYVCSGSAASDCMVELVGEALTNLLTASMGSLTNEVSTGTYTSVMVGTCWEEQSYNAELKATVSLNGQTYYTKTGSTTMVTDQSQHGAVSFEFSACRNYSILDSAITVGEAALTVNLFIDLRNLVVALTKDGTIGITNGGSCMATPSTLPSTSDPFLCLDYPNVAGSILTQPTLERYRVEASNESSAAKIIGLYFASDGTTPIGGFVRDLFDATYTGASNVFGSFKRAYLEADSLIVTDYGATDSIAGNGQKTISGFPRLEVGQSQTSVSQVDSNGSSTGVTVTVTRLE